jgi:transcriptional regulator with XRE-family HTH domain
MLDLNHLGQNIRFQRKGRGWSLSELELHSKVPKAYLSDLENGRGGKPNIQYLYQIANSLGTTIDALIHGSAGAAISPDVLDVLPPGIREFAQDAQLTDDEIRMLAALNFRGNRPSDRDSWRAIYDVIKLASNQK